MGNIFVLHLYVTFFRKKKPKKGYASSIILKTDSESWDFLSTQTLAGKCHYTGRWWRQIFGWCYFNGASESNERKKKTWNMRRGRRWIATRIDALAKWDRLKIHSTALIMMLSGIGRHTLTANERKRERERESEWKENQFHSDLFAENHRDVV